MNKMKRLALIIAVMCALMTILPVCSLAAAYDTYCVINYDPNGGGGRRTTVTHYFTVYAAGAACIFDVKQLNELGFTPPSGYTAPPNTPWNTSPSGYGQACNRVWYAGSGQTYTFYAQWLPVEYGLTLETVVDGVSIAAADYAYATGKRINIAPPVVEGYDLSLYSFVGWTMVTGKGTFDDAATANSTFVTGNATTKLRATYASMHEVSFYDADGNVILTVQVPHGTSATPPEPPVREGYVFLGWDTDFSSVTTDVITKARYIADVNLDGVFNTGDAVKSLRYAAGLETYNGTQMAVGDYNFDGALNTGDAVCVLVLYTSGSYLVFD